MSEHIEDEQLARFLLGQLDEVIQANIENHLEICPHCAERAAAYSPTDSLVELLSATYDQSILLAADPIGSGATKTQMAWKDEDDLDFTQSRLARMSDRIEEANQGLNDAELSKLKPPTDLERHARYKILRPLGRGGMGTVWLAQHLLMNRYVALKVVRPEFLTNVGAVERFRREVQAVAMIQHPNVVTAYDAEQIGDTHFLVVEFVEGETLAQRLANGPLPILVACEAIRDAALGLGFAHQSGVIHRDLKPSNLIQARNGSVKILDFGLVAIPSIESSITGANMIVGTPDYLSPEQAESPHLVDERSDFYSLGCTMYHLVVGTPPFPNRSVLKKMDAHRQEMPLFPSEIPPGLRMIVTKMMAKQPNQRYQSALQIVEAIDAFSATARADPTKAKLSPRLRSRRHVALGGVSFVAASVFAWQVGSKRLFSTANRPTGAPNVTQLKPAANSDPHPHASATQGLIYQLRKPTAMGDGVKEDFRIVGDDLIVDAMSSTTQVWLNYKLFTSKNFAIRASIRFHEVAYEPMIKFVFLADNGPEYSVQFAILGDGDFVLVKEAFQAEQKNLASFKLSQDLRRTTMTTSITLKENRLAVTVDDQPVISINGIDDLKRYPAIAVRLSRVDLLNPIAEQWD